LKYTPIDAEARTYKDYMFYGPIPYSETQKWSQLQQNVGW
jgi:starch-binding outer membrane protein, SusD/RagB family